MLVHRRLTSVLVIISMTILLPGCTAGIIAMQAIPAVIGGGAIAGARDRSPFEIPVGPIKSEESMNLAMLDEHIRKADCGDALSQFQLAWLWKINSTIHRTLLRFIVGIGSPRWEVLSWQWTNARRLP